MIPSDHFVRFYNEAFKLFVRPSGVAKTDPQEVRPFVARRRRVRYFAVHVIHGVIKILFYILKRRFVPFAAMLVRRAGRREPYRIELAETARRNLMTKRVAKSWIRDEDV